MRRAEWLVLLLASSLIAGCGDGKPSIDTSRTEGTVTGTVTVKGQPATGGAIQFNPSNSGRIVPTRSAPIGPDGSYTITTYTGGNQVRFDGEVAAKNRGVGLMREYVDVRPGENKVDFDLMGAGAKVGPYDLSKLEKKKGR
jgi:hypothetical protein